MKIKHSAYDVKDAQIRGTNLRSYMANFDK